MMMMIIIIPHPFFLDHCSISDFPFIPPTKPPLHTSKKKNIFSPLQINMLHASYVRSILPHYPFSEKKEITAFLMQGSKTSLMAVLRVHFDFCSLADENLSPRRV